MSPPSDVAIDRLKEISKWVSSVQDLDQLLELIVYTATTMMNGKASSLLLVDNKTGRLYFKIATGEKKDDVKKYEIDPGQGIAGYVAQTGEALLIPDVTQDDRWFKEISDSLGFQTRTIVCVPLNLDGQTIGVIEIIDKRDDSPFHQDDVRTLTAFAELAALAIGNARKIESVRRENLDLKQELGLKYQIVGESKSLKKVIADAFKVANSNSTTLIMGESGTGKELLARLIHRAGARRDKPLISLNCAALPESLLEDELFGHDKGAYTGATSKKVGKFELADGGTLFLDEIGEMSVSMQAKLLRVLQEGVFYRVGGITSVNVDVRIISASNRDIGKEVVEGRFREDLYYRLNVVQLFMPPLRDRMEDAPILAQYFMNQFKQEQGLSRLTLSEKALSLICQYHWPGNVRELRNAIERAVVMGDGAEIKPEDLPIHPGDRSDMGVEETGLTLEEAVHRFRKKFIRRHLKATGGNRSQAAKKMGIQRTYLSRLIGKYNITGI
jgi:Nif-specific regulatory protein